MNSQKYISQYSDILLYHGLLVLGGTVILSVLIHLLYQRRSPTAIISWLLSILLIPYIALPLYLVIGFRKRDYMYKKETLNIGDGNKTAEVEVFLDAAEAFERLLSDIENTEHSIYISMYILRYDTVGKKVINALAKKASEGVKVKLLIDSLGSMPLYLLQYRLKKFKNSGAEVEFFMPIFEMPFRNYINLRNHRKIYIFDDEKVLSGGANISRQYFATKKSKNEWEDIMFMIKGESVEDFFDIFASDWLYSSGKKIEFAPPEEIRRTDTFVHVVPSGPDMQRDALYEALLGAIFGAKEKIYIVTPYFIPNETLVQALIIAKHRGVDVRLITPKEANHTIVNLVRSSYMRELEERGIKIHLYEKAMLHAKAIIFDEQSVMLGSVNFDNRSLFLNYEVATFIYSREIIDRMLSWSKKLIADSSSTTKEASGAKIVFENLLRVLAPQL